MGYYVGDIPAQDLVIDPVRGDEPVDLAPFSTAEATLYGPAGAEVDVIGFAATIDPEQNLILIDWPTVSPFAAAGIYQLRIAVGDPVTGVSEMLPPVRLAVDTFNGWHTLDTAREEWQDAPGMDAWLFELLQIARTQVEAYAPRLATGVAVPVHYRLAQLAQARNIWNATKVDPASGSMGDDTFIIRPFPLDWQITQMLRPRSPIPVVG